MEFTNCNRGSAIQVDNAPFVPVGVVAGNGMNLFRRLLSSDKVSHETEKEYH